MNIRIIAFLLLSHSFVGCQNGPDDPNLAAAGLGFNTAAGQGKPQPTATNIVFKSTDGGQTWQDASDGLPIGLEANCVVSDGGELFLGAENGLYRASNTAIGSKWQKDFFMGERIAGIFPGLNGQFALSYDKGFFQKIRGTNIWASVHTGFTAKLRTIFESPDGRVFVGTDDGIFKSADGGKNWKHVHEDGWVIKMVESGGTLVCTNEQGILRSVDGGEHWENVLSEGGVGIDVAVIEGGFAAITYNTESETRRMRISTDGGKTWQPIDAGLPPQASIASIRQVGGYFFCGHPDGIFRSADRGKTWKLVLPTIKEKVFNLTVSGNVIFAVARNGGC